MENVFERKTVRKAVFLDRDGTLNVEKDYLHRIEDFEFIPGAPEAIKKLKDAGFLVIVITNQSGVGRGYYTLQDVDRLHEHIQKKLSEAGTAIDAFYVCPHHPTEGVSEYKKDCDCRKGKPGMLLQAAQDFNIDLSRSYMVGDKEADIEAGEKAGCRSIMVLTGYGEEAAKHMTTNSVLLYEDIRQAAEYILQTPRNNCRD